MLLSLPNESPDPLSSLFVTCFQGCYRPRHLFRLFCLDTTTCKTWGDPKPPPKTLNPKPYRIPTAGRIFKSSMLTVMRHKPSNVALPPKASEQVQQWLLKPQNEYNNGPAPLKMVNNVIRFTNFGGSTYSLSHLLSSKE